MWDNPRPCLLTGTLQMKKRKNIAFHSSWPVCALILFSDSLETRKPKERERAKEREREQNPFPFFLWNFAPFPLMALISLTLSIPISDYQQQHFSRVYKPAA